MIRKPPFNWVIAFAMFWYHFIVGDDWTLAAAVAVGLAVSGAFAARHVSVWWLMPALVVVMVGFDLRRAGRVRR